MDTSKNYVEIRYRSILKIKAMINNGPHLFLKVVLNSCLNLYKDVDERMHRGKAVQVLAPFKVKLRLNSLVCGQGISIKLFAALIVG